MVKKLCLDCDVNICRAAERCKPCSSKVRWKNPEYKKYMSENISKSLTGRKLSDEHRKNVGLAQKGKKLSDEHKDNIRKSIKKLGIEPPHPRGEDSPTWVQDRTLLKQGEKKHLDGRYREWMGAVKKRDNWKCKIMDENCSGRLESHHILDWVNYPELRYEINNGITLCHAHHPRGRAEEKRLVLDFQGLVSVSRK